MRYGFINNFSQTLAADLAAGATTMTLDGGGALLSAASSTFRYTMTLFGGAGNIEVINVTSGGTNSITITRGEEGTTAQEWPAGTSVEMRLTAAVVSGFAYGLSSSSIHPRAVSIQPVRSSADQVASGYGAVAIAEHTKATQYMAVAIGAYSEATGTNAAAFGSGSRAAAEDALALGDDAYADFPYATAVGSGAQAASDRSTVVGAFALDYGASDYGVALGAGANIDGIGSMAVGHDATTYAAGQVALGPGAYPNRVQSAMDITAIPVMRSTILAAKSYQHAAARRITLPVLLRTADVSLATVGDKDSLSLPVDTSLMVDRIEVVIISSAENSYTPTISIGTTLGGTDIVSGYIMSGSTVMRREQLVSTPLADAITAMYFKVDAAAAGIMTARLVVHGYVMEV